MKLIARTVEALKPEVNSSTAWNDKLAGFGVRVQPSGLRSEYRAHGWPRGKFLNVALKTLKVCPYIEARSGQCLPSIWSLFSYLPQTRRPFRIASASAWSMESPHSRLIAVQSFR